MNKSPLSFCIAICSRRRPKSLAHLFEVILTLDIPANVRFSVLVVENDDAPQYGVLINEMKEKLALTYVVEPIAGLTYARNRVLSEAEALGVDWIGCIDDDVTLNQDWLEHMVRAIGNYPDTAFFFGNWLRTDDPDSPSWYPQQLPLNKSPTGKRVTVTAGGNIALRADVFSSSGMGLRYDHAFRFLGGEDTDFTMQYLAKDGIIRSVYEASGREVLRRDRAGFAERMERSTNSQYILAKLRHKHQAQVLAVAWSLQSLYRGTVLGVGCLLLAGVMLPINKGGGLVLYGKGRNFLAGARGVLRYYFGKGQEPYKNVAGD